MNKLVVFDFDGTLIHSLPDIACSIQKTLAHFSAPTKTIEQIGTYIGNGAKNLVKRAFDGNLTEEQLLERLAYYSNAYKTSGAPLTTVFDGIFEVINELKKRGYKIALLTNKPQDQTDKIFARLFSECAFDMVVGDRADRKRKPDPTELINIVNTLGASKEQTYMVGDGDADVQTALNAGVSSICVLWGYRSKEQLEKVGGTVFINNPTELLDIIK